VCGGCARTSRTPVRVVKPLDLLAISTLGAGTGDAQATGMDKQAAPSYEIDRSWKIVRVNDAFCREFKCSESGLVGRDIRDLMRGDWRLDFRSYVSKALVGVGEPGVALPMVAPCGEQGWYTHQLQAVMQNGVVAGYRATLAPHGVHAATGPRRWFNWRPAAPRTVWNFEADQLSKVS
jgi:PAS domain-containing protein